MLEYDIIIKYLEESLEPLTALEVLEKLSGEHAMPYGIRNKVNRVIIDIQTILKAAIISAIKENVDSVNAFICNNENFNLKGKLLTITNLRVYCIDKIVFQFEEWSLNEYKRFINEFPNIKHDTLQLATLISSNRNKLAPLIQHAFNILRQDYPNYTFSLCSQLAVSEQDGKEILIISNNNMQFKIVINYCIDNYNLETIKMQITNNFLDGFKYQINESKKDQIKSFLYRICDKYDLPRLNKINFKVNEKKAYNLQDGWINLNIDLNDEKLINKLEAELHNAITMILFLRNIDNWFGKGNINIGKDLYFNFIDEKIINNNTYTLYESRVNNNKILLHTFCNGQQLTGNARKKILELFNKHRKKNDIPWDLYYYNNGTYINNKKLTNKISKKYNCNNIGLSMEALKDILKEYNSQLYNKGEI